MNPGSMDLFILICILIFFGYILKELEIDKLISKFSKDVIPFFWEECDIKTIRMDIYTILIILITIFLLVNSLF